jgi:hypothetical protein
VKADGTRPGGAALVARNAGRPRNAGRHSGHAGANPSAIFARERNQAGWVAAAAALA